MNKQRKRGYSITPQGLALIDQKRLEKGYTVEKLAEVAGISIDTLKSLQRQENKDKKTIEAIVNALGIQLIDIVDANELYPQSENKVKDESNIYWLNICHKMLENQQEQQNNRRKASSMGYEVNVHIPLGLVERKQQQRRNENIEREEIYKLEPEVITKTYQHDEFLQEIINKGNHRKNKHIAIVGEPGAGKTTLLNAVATYIKNETQELPIFIFLGSLLGMTLTDYVIKKWLPDATRLVNIVPNKEIEEQFKSAFYQGKFWLLLDGVDEMGESSPIQALNKIAQELTNWLGQARIILSCRLNVWDATFNNNILPGFNTFKTQEFKPEDVEKFIRDWFEEANKISHGEELILQLQQEGKERIRELVTNPLRLCLLCQIFEQDENGELPETKAQFYELFTRYFYEWKPELVPDLIKSYELREKLHQGLGNLALAGINSDVKFRLKRSFAVKAMGDERLFNLACEVGWLNQVDRDAINDEDVYAFFHPNFQEYFAALIIDDWHYFLNHVPQNPDEAIYRVFEPKWKELMLMWIGRKDIKTEDKESFMNTLIDFPDNCNSICNYFYYEQPDFLGALLIVEFSNFNRGYEIVENLVEYSFGYFENNSKKWEKLPYFIAKQAKEILKITHPSHVVNAIFNRIRILLEVVKNEYLDQQEFTELFYDMFWTLNKFDPNHYFVVNMLSNLIEEGQYWYNNDDENPKVFPYDEIKTSNSDIVNKLSEMLVKSYNCIVDKRNKEKMKKEIKKKQPKNDNSYNDKYEKMNFNNFGRIIITQDYSDYLCKIAASHIEEDERLNNLVGINEKIIKIAGIFNDITITLTRVAYRNKNILNLFINILKQEFNDTNFEHDFCLNLVVSIGKFEGNKQELINFINENLTNNAVDNYRRCCLAQYLLKLEPQNNLAINILIEALANIKDDKMSLRIISTLVEMNYDNKQIINKLIQLLYDERITDSEKNSNLNVDTNFKKCLDRLDSWFNLLHKNTREQAINYLAKIAYQSNDVRIVLDDIFQNSHNIFLRENVAWRILEAEPNNQVALIFLLDRYKNNDDSYQYFTEQKFTDCLDKFPELTNNFINVLSNCQDATICSLIIRLLGTVNHEKYQLSILRTFNTIFSATTDEDIIFEIALSLGELDILNRVENEKYKLEIIEILKEILKKTKNEDTICAAATSLGKIEFGNIDVNNILINLLNNNLSNRSRYWLEERLSIIADQNINVINTLINITNNNDDDIKFTAIKNLSRIGSGNLEVVKTLINLMNNPKESENYWLIRKSLIQILKGNLFAVAVSGLKDRWINDDEEDTDLFYILWHCAQNMTYTEFYRAWHGESSTIENIEKQFTDINSLLTQLQPTNKIYPLGINLKTLEDETENSAIAQEICNQIYFTVFNEPEEIPEVNNAPQLKRIIPQVKKHLQTENIVLIINNCEPNEAMIKFCHKLTDVLSIAFITEQPLDAPLKGFPPNQPNLLGAVQTWISEIG